MVDVFILMASKNEGGKTAKLLNFYLNKLKKSQQKQLKFQLINVYSLKIIPCDGCGFCRTGKACPKSQFDDFLKVVDLIKKCDDFVVATPTYFLSFPSKLKALVDRCEQFYCKKLKKGSFCNLKLTRGHLVLSAGNLKFASLVQILNCCSQFFSCLNVEFKKCVVAPETDFRGLFFLIKKLF